MRYPIGTRDTLPEAIAAGYEASLMTGMRYIVGLVFRDSDCPEGNSDTCRETCCRKWEFIPTAPPTEHQPTRV